MNFKKLIISLTFFATSFNAFSMQDANAKLEIAISENKQNHFLNLPNDILFAIFCYVINESEDTNEIAKRLAPIFLTCSKFYKMICQKYHANKALQKLILMKAEVVQEQMIKMWHEKCLVTKNDFSKIEKISLKSGSSESILETLMTCHYLQVSDIYTICENYSDGLDGLRKLFVNTIPFTQQFFKIIISFISELIKICPFGSKTLSDICLLSGCYDLPNLMELALKNGAQPSNEFLFNSLLNQNITSAKILIKYGAIPKKPEQRILMCSEAIDNVEKIYKKLKEEINQENSKNQKIE